MPSLVAYAVRRALIVAVAVVAAPVVTYFILRLVDGGQDFAQLVSSTWDYARATYLHFDLGVTGVPPNQKQISQILLEGLPVDVGLVAGGLVVGVAVGLTTGLYGARRPRTVLDRTLLLGSAGALSVPVYWLCYVVIFLIAPQSGEVVQLGFVSQPGGYVGLTDDPIGWLHAMWVPWVVLAIPLAATCHRMTRAAIAGEEHEDWVRTARSKGISERRVWWRHIAPAGMPPVVTLVGASLALLVTNAILIEPAFNMPGLFRHADIGQFRGEIGAHTPPISMVQAVVLEAAVIIGVATLACEVLIAWLDPRVRAQT